jgi:hypothetical protein
MQDEKKLAQTVNPVFDTWSNSDILDALRRRCPKARRLGKVISAVVRADGTCSWAAGECLPTPRTEVLRCRNYRTGEVHIVVFGADHASVKAVFDAELEAARRAALDAKADAA